MARRKGMTQLGCTTGLAQPREYVGDRPPRVAYDPEQVLVWRDDTAEPWVDGGNRTHAARSILIEGWSGWIIPATLKLTARQAAELGAILTRAATTTGANSLVGTVADSEGSEQ